MLVLTRKQDETILIGEGIEVRILRIKGNAISVGINAARDIPIRRGELPPTTTATSVANAKHGHEAA